MRTAIVAALAAAGIADPMVLAGELAALVVFVLAWGFRR
jgi:hypothetical protein